MLLWSSVLALSAIESCDECRLLLLRSYAWSASQLRPAGPAPRARRETVEAEAEAEAEAEREMGQDRGGTRGGLGRFGRLRFHTARCVQVKDGLESLGDLVDLELGIVVVVADDTWSGFERRSTPEGTVDSRSFVGRVCGGDGRVCC